MYKYMSYKQSQSEAQRQAYPLSTESDSSDSIKRVYLSIDIEYRYNNSEYGEFVHECMKDDHDDRFKSIN